MTSGPTLRPLSALVAGVIVLAGCASTADPGNAPTGSTTRSAGATPTTAASPTPTPTPAPTATDEPLTVTDSTGEQVTLDDPAEAIVSLSPTATESLFAIGAGDQVVAADQFSYFPEDAPTTDLDALNPNVEAIAEHEPDLVIAESHDEALADGLEAIDVELLVQSAAATFDDVYTQIEHLGTLTGHPDDATALVERIRTDIDMLVVDAPDASGQTYFHELDSTLYTVTSETFIGRVYDLFGLVNIADEAEAASGNAYPQLSPEYVVDANPDWIFLADAAFGESADTVAQRPGWDAIDAVDDDHVVALPADIPSRWGPRVVDFVAAISQALSGTGEAAATPTGASTTG